MPQLRDVYVIVTRRIAVIRQRLVTKLARKCKSQVVCHRAVKTKSASNPSNRSICKLGAWWVALACAALASAGCGKREAARADSGEGEKAKATQALPAATSPIDQILMQTSPQCFACGKKPCSEFIDGCASIAGNAEAGPAKGKAKAELCRETLACVLKNHCVKGDASFSCYCGKVDGQACLSSSEVDGPCKSQIQAGLESTTSGEIAQIWLDSNKGGGAALALAHCLVDNGCKACF